MNLATLPGWAADLLRDGRVGRLGFTDGDGLPRVLPITFALAGGSIWSAIDAKPKRSAEPARVRWLRERPEAALVVDHYSDDWSELGWVQVLGRVCVVDAEHGGEALAELTRKYSQYAADPPPGPVLRLDVDRALCWRAGDA